VSITLRDLIPASVPINLKDDGSIQATMPASITSPYTIVLSDISTPGCYLIGAANDFASGSATITTGGSGNINLYLVVWRTTDTLFFAIIAKDNGEAWDRWPILFLGVALMSYCCIFDSTGTASALVLNELDGTGAVVNEKLPDGTLSLAVPEELVTAGIFRSTTPPLVVAAETGSANADVWVRCCPPCFYEAQPDVTVSSDDPACSFFNGTYSYGTGGTGGGDGGDGSDEAPDLDTSGDPDFLGSCEAVYFKFEGGGFETIRVYYNKGTKVWTVQATTTSGGTVRYQGTTTSLSCIDGVLTGTVSIPALNPQPGGSTCSTSGTLTVVFG
jgi:hypothetical protein